VSDEFVEGTPKVPLAERHHASEALVLDRPDEPFGVGVRIRRLHDVHTGFAPQASNTLPPFPITITDQHAMIAAKARFPSVCGRLWQR